MKIAILDTYYQPVIDDLVKSHFFVSKKRLLAQAFGTADFYSKNLISLGHMAEDFILNAHIFIPNIFLFQMKKFRPDIIYCQNLSIPGSKLLKQISPRPKLIVGQIASPTSFDNDYLSGYDLIITSFPHYVEKYRKLKINCEYLPLAFEHTLLERLTPQEKIYDAVFVGNNFPHHQKAVPAFAFLGRQVRFDVWGLNWDNFPGAHPPVWGLPMFKIYQQAKIVVNRHVDAAKNFANNMRLFESTGVGTMLITDWKDNLDDFFTLGKEVESYRSKAELVEKVKYYLKNDTAREKIARAGQRRTLRDHTYKLRMKALAKILKKYV